jgi:tetratricopeptide (TPR) repeat protein
MYLRGSKWSMNRRRKRPNWFRIILLSLLVLGGSYFNRYILPSQPSPFVPTPTATRDPESYVTQAEELFAQGKLLPAIESFKSAIVADPNDPTVYVSVARVQVWAGLYQDAQTSAEDALLLNPNNSMAHAVRAWALDFQGNFLEAEAGIKRALELDPNNGLAHAYYVEILIDSYISGSGSFEGINTAIEESRVALALSPNTIEAHRARAYILEATANYEEAIHEYQAAIALNANIADLHLALGRNYRALGIYDQAVEEFTRANALNPSDPTPDLLISRTYATIGEYAKAAQYAETAMKDNPADTNLHGNLGVMYYHNLLWPEAVRELALVANGGLTEDGQRVNAIMLIPDTRIAEYYFTYGLALARLGRCGDALKVAQMLQDRVPSDEIAVANAEEIVNICRRNLNVTVTPTEEGEASAEGALPAETPTQ